MEHRVVVNGTVVGKGPHLARYLREARRRFPGAEPQIQIHKINAVAIFQAM